MKTHAPKQAIRKGNEELRRLTAKAAETATQADTARTKARRAKAAYKHARKAFKLAKKAAKLARKKAKALQAALATSSKKTGQTKKQALRVHRRARTRKPGPRRVPEQLVRKGHHPGPPGPGRRAATRSRRGLAKAATTAQTHAKRSSTSPGRKVAAPRSEAPLIPASLLASAREDAEPQANAVPTVASQNTTGPASATTTRKASRPGTSPPGGLAADEVGA
jgi:hypothetical protein